MGEGKDALLVPSMAPSLRKIGEKREERRIEEEKEKEWVEGRDTCTQHGALSLEDRREERGERREG